MTIEEKRKLLQKIEANRIKRILLEEISAIRYVKDWAEIAGCSKTKLNRIVNVHFGMPAKKMMKEVRLNKIKQVLSNDPYCGGYYVAKVSGLSNEQELYKFLKRNFNTSITDLKYQIQFNKMDI